MSALKTDQLKNYICKTVAVKCLPQFLLGLSSIYRVSFVIPQKSKNVCSNSQSPLNSFKYTPLYIEPEFVPFLLLVGNSLELMKALQ